MSIKHDPANARRHGERNKATIKSSLEQCGAGRSIVLDAEDVIVAGNGVYEQAQALGLPVRVIETDGKELIAVKRTDIKTGDDRRKLLALADNRTAELAEWDAEALNKLLADIPTDALDGIGLSSADIEAIIGDATGSGEGDGVDAEPQIDKAAELNKKWKVKTGDLWQLGEHRLLCGDSTKVEDVERCLGGVMPLLMVTDPPYGVEYDADWCNHAFRADGSAIAGRAVGKVANDDRADWSDAWRLFPGDVAYVWHAGVHSPVVADSLAACDFERRALIIWAKQQMVIGRGDYHHQHEPCWYCVRKGKPGHRTEDRKQTTLWQIDKPHKSETGHSTQKPVECMARPIRNHDSEYVYEPFSGSGTTIIACEQLGRKCRAIEISPDYVAVALQRYLDATGKEPKRI